MRGDFGVMTYSLLTRPDRLAALRHTALLDTPPEEGFDRLTRMASRLLGTPIALISLVAEDRQFFKSAIGLPEPWASRRGAPLSFSFCAQVVSNGEQLVVEDARKHPLLRHSTAIRELGWVAYAGVPLITPDGQTVGSLSVVDKMPRLWSERDIGLLKDLAAAAVSEIELRRETARRRLAELGRRDGEGQYQSTFDQAGIGMAIISPDGRWLRVNRALCDLLEVAPEELVGSLVEARTHPDDAPADREAVRLLLAGESRSYTVEKRFLTQSGAILWALVNVSLVPADGDPAHLIATIQDISERKEWEVRVGASEERYRLVTQASREAVLDWDLTSNEMVWNDPSGPFLDYPPSELGATADWWYERLHPDDRERVVESLDSAIRDGETVWLEEYRFRRSDGAYADVQSRARILHDETDAPIRLISVIAELPEGRSSGQQLQQVLDALPAGLWIVDRQNTIILENAASREIWGPLRSTGLDQITAFQTRWASTDQPVRSEELAPAFALRGQEPAPTQEITVEVPGAGRKTVQLAARPIRDAAGQLVGAVCISEDVTARRMDEASRSRREDQEHQADKMDAIGRLAGGIAHDFNNLLTGILTYSELILQELHPQDPIRADIEQIRHAGQRAAGLTRQLLAFSRRQVLQPQVVSVPTLVAELEPMLGRLLGPDVALDLLLDPSTGNVVVDPGQLEQVLINLIMNAREAMPGGGRVSIETANVELEAGYVAIAVKDTGVGMDAATRARMFEPFFTTKHGSSGTGLGLSTVYGIVEQSGGRISVVSEPGQGTEFTVYLPRYTGAEPAIRTAKSGMRRGGAETVLLVEDEVAVRSSVRRLLEWHGYRVVEAPNGAEALRIYQENPASIDMVVTDMAMPEMSGDELIERLRIGNPALKVLFMSGYTERSLPASSRESPRTGFIDKPFTVDTLMQKLREVLEQ
jgi:two-component system, cell cycle sensor histidine kinase and response regulator CckA